MHHVIRAWLCIYRRALLWFQSPQFRIKLVDLMAKLVIQYNKHQNRSEKSLQTLKRFIDVKRSRAALIKSNDFAGNANVMHYKIQIVVFAIQLCVCHRNLHEIDGRFAIASIHMCGEPMDLFTIPCAIVVPSLENLITIEHLQGHLDIN